MSDHSRRKQAHVEAVLSGKVNFRQKTVGFEAVDFLHEALPELKLSEINLATKFLGKRVSAPFLISSMTGGTPEAARINVNLAEAAEALGIALAVGSQRVALVTEHRGGLDLQLRAHAPSVPIYANLGAIQLVNDIGIDQLRRAIAMIDADALILHLNPLQEALQSGGDTDWRGVEAAIAAACRALEVPVIVKEVGFGISASTARRLADCGVQAIDVAGAGGTSWAAVEGAVSLDPSQAMLGETFRDWGLPTAMAIADVRKALPHMPIIGSGGIRSGLDAAKAIRLGADLIGQAGAVLAQAIKGPDSVVRHFEALISGLRIACFATGSGDLKALKAAPLLQER
jgi:isopentenyl-diphosphate delta-isomerase